MINKLAILFVAQFAFYSLSALEKPDNKPLKGHIDFKQLSKNQFSKFPAKNSRIKGSVLWTRGESGGKYPPSVGIPIKETDCTISFRFRHLGDGKSIWFFVNGNDSFGGFDHILRVKLLRTGIVLQIDGHTKNAKDPKLLKLPAKQRARKADTISGAFRVPEKLPMDKLNLKDKNWHELKLSFKKNMVSLSLDETAWKKQLTHAGFAFEKQELYFMQDGGEKGIEITDLKLTSD